VDRCDIETSPAGTLVTMSKLLPPSKPLLDRRDLGRLAGILASQRPSGALGEVLEQNQELLRALETLQAKQEELEQVNRELEDTNRGVVALYAELDERADRLRRVDEIKTRFLSNMTHEFRTPVNSILALSRLLAERLQVNQSDKNELFYIRKAAQQLSDLVNDLLDIAKVEAGKVDVRPTYFEVKALFGALRAMLRPLLVTQSLTLVFEEAEGLPAIYSDESKVSQILRNFISNSLKYTERGEVRVTCAYRREDDVVQFSVSDTGIGIPEEQLERVFDEFVQIENPLQRRTKGTGLGLPLSRRLAELLGGRLSVTSELGQGSTFSLTLPVLFPGTVTTAGEMPPAETGATAILVASPVDTTRFDYHRALSLQRFHALLAASPEGADNLLRTWTPAAILLHLPSTAGEWWTWFARIKRNAPISRIPVLVVADDEGLIKAQRLGADAVMAPQEDLRDLVRELRWLIGEKDSAVPVLAVDDDEAFRYIVRESLSGPTFRLFEADSGAQALEMLETFTPQVMLLDLNMPGADGFAVAARVRSDPRLCEVPIIVLTSQPVTAEDRQRLQSVGPILSKSSLSREVLRSAIQDAVVRARGESAQPAT
jgi:signal transduction histidine kinase/CheY-like chemotaxis protein